MVDFECGKCDWKGSHNASEDLISKCPQCEIPKIMEERNVELLKDVVVPDDTSPLD